MLEWLKSAAKHVSHFFWDCVSSVQNRWHRCFGSNIRAPYQLLPLQAPAVIKSTSFAAVLQILESDQPLSSLPFGGLPNDMLTEIGARLPKQPDQPDQQLSPFSHFIASSKQLYHLLQPQRLVDKFYQYIVYGNQSKIEEMLKKGLQENPELFTQLLTQKGKVIDYSGREIEGTALQLALGAEDVKYHDNEECMAEVLMRALKQLPNGEAIIATQIQAQFPEGWEEAEKARQARDLAALKTVVAALENAQVDDNCDAAIQAFIKYLDDKNKGRGVIRTGKHFSAQLLIDAFNWYVEKYDLFGGRYDSPKNLLFWRRVIGNIERYWPANYAQAMCQGVYYIVEEREKLARRLTFRHAPSVTFFPLDSNPVFRLGVDYAPCVLAGGLEPLPGGRVAVGLAVAKLCQTKNINVAAVMPRRRGNYYTENRYFVV